MKNILVNYRENEIEEENEIIWLNFKEKGLP